MQENDEQTLSATVEDHLATGERAPEHSVAACSIDATTLVPSQGKTTKVSKFKYKYSEASQDGGCPDGVSEEEWNKIYTAADSRIYNKHGKNANASRIRRQTGETRELALAMLLDRNNAAAGVTTGPTSATGSQPRPYMPKGPSASRASTNHFTTYVPAPTPGEIFLDGKAPLSVTEQIKMGGRDRRLASVTEAVKQESPDPALGHAAFAKVHRKPPRKKLGPKSKTATAASKDSAAKAAPVRTGMSARTPDTCGDRNYH